jgi:hypothetical protein
MATVDMALRAGDGVNSIGRWSGSVRTPYLLYKEINLATAVTTKGTALALNDVIQALDIPANSMLIAGGAIKVSAMTGTSTDLTFDIGITGVDADVLVDGWDFDAAAVASHATPLGVQTTQVFTSAGTIDILIATMTGTLTGGKVGVYALLVDVGTTTDTPGIAALQS